MALPPAVGPGPSPAKIWTQRQDKIRPSRRRERDVYGSGSELKQQFKLSRCWMDIPLRYKMTGPEGMDGGV